MRPGLTIGEMHADIHVDEPDEGARLVALHAGVGAQVESALRRRRSPSNDLVFVREIEVPVTVRVGGTDLAIQEAWAGAIADRLADAVAQEGRCDGVVRYPSEQAVVFDVAHGLSTGDSSRRWAWGLAGLCSSSGSDEDIADGITRWLEDRPWTIPHLMNAVARQGRLGSLLGRLGDGRVRRLVTACRTGRSPGAASAPGTPVRIDARTVAASPMAAALQSDVRLRWTGHATVAALAAFVARLLLPVGEIDERTVTLVRSLLEVEPDRPSDSDERLQDERPGNEATEPGSTEPESVSDLASPGHRPTPDDPRPSAGSHDAAEAYGDAPQPLEPTAEPEPVSVTHHAGLLYLLNLLTEPDLFAAVIPDLDDRSIGWTLWHLGASLAGDATDPAVAVFSGRLPVDPPPTESPVPAEAARIALAVEDLAVELCRRTRSEHPPPAVLRRVVDRRATIDAIDGWCDVYFDLEDIDIDVRVAGLDQDPGFIPFLGTVVRFSYV